jgi:hypothetical protein|tara:strand:- start:644 stop:871 length:228 start_codon:yes stop_codon:yes gene_type:complete
MRPKKDTVSINIRRLPVELHSIIKATAALNRATTEDTIVKMLQDNIEDAGLSKAMEEAEGSEMVSRKEIMQILKR